MQPQPSRPISALALSSPHSDPLCTPTFRPVSLPPVVPTLATFPPDMEIDSVDPPSMPAGADGLIHSDNLVHSV